jgi:hypothetical protein
MNSTRVIILLFLLASIGMAQARTFRPVEYSRLPESTVGIICLRSWEGGDDFVAWFDAAVDSARYDDGLVIDVRGCGGGEVNTVAQAMGRLTNATLHTMPEIRPRGEWQFDLPIVVLMDESAAPPTDFFLRAVRLRSQIETVGRAMRIGGTILQPGYVVTAEMYQTMHDLNPSRDPIFDKGLDELYRMIGRLRWLQDERRKEMLQDTARPPRRR